MRSCSVALIPALYERAHPIDREEHLKLIFKLLARPNSELYVENAAPGFELTVLGALMMWLLSIRGRGGSRRTGGPDRRLPVAVGAEGCQASCKEAAAGGKGLQEEAAAGAALPSC